MLCDTVGKVKVRVSGEGEKGSEVEGRREETWTVFFLSGWKHIPMMTFKSLQCKDLPNGPVIKISPSNARDEGSIPGGGAEIPYASRPRNKKTTKQKQYCNKFNKDFENGSHQKNLRTSLVGQWLRICVPVLGTQIQSLLQEDSTCCGAMKPLTHNYWTLPLQLLKPVCPRAHAPHKISHCNENLCSETRE